MPVCTLHLLSLEPSTSIASFLDALRSSQLEPVVVAKVIRWIIRPSKFSVGELLNPRYPWHLFLLLPSDDFRFPSNLQSLLWAHWSIRAGVPFRLLENFSSKNHQLLHPHPDTIPSLTGSLLSPRVSQSSQTLELSPSLHAWITGPEAASSLTHSSSTAVSMLNLLSFHNSPSAKESYLQYGMSFAKSVGLKRGGVAKIVGAVPGKQDGWDEIALAHYPSLLHFGDMLASKDYQEVNQRYRVGSLRDTAILCLCEGAVEGQWEKPGGQAPEKSLKGEEKGKGPTGMEHQQVKSKL